MQILVWTDPSCIHIPYPKINTYLDVAAQFGTKASSWVEADVEANFLMNVPLQSATELRRETLVEPLTVLGTVFFLDAQTMHGITLGKDIHNSPDVAPTSCIVINEEGIIINQEEQQGINFINKGDRLS